VQIDGFISALQTEGRLRLVVVGWGLLGWLISYPFYGVPAFTLLGEQAALFCHLFGGGLAAGFLLAGFLLPFRHVPHQLVQSAGLLAVAVSLLCLVSRLFVFLAPAAGLLAALPIFAWGCRVAKTAPLIPVLAGGVVGANLLCWFSRVFAATKATALPVVIVLSSVWCCGLFFLPALLPTEKRPLVVARLIPLFLFAVAAYPTYGIRFRVLLPLVAGFGVGARLGCLPYIIAFATAAVFAVRSSPAPVAALGLSFLGLASVSLAALSAFSPTLVLLLFAFTAALAGLACVDFFIGWRW